MVYDIQMKWPAQTALESLDATDRSDVTFAIDRLRDGPNPAGVPQVYTIRAQPTDVQVLSVGRGQRLRLLFTAADGVITLHDIVSSNLVADYRRTVVR